MPHVPSIGLELPPLVLPDHVEGSSASDHLLPVVRALEAAGQGAFDAIWLNGTSGRMAADPCTMAGGLAETSSDVALGVVETLHDVEQGRNPALLARDLVALDHVSGGRAALALADGELGPTMPPAPDRPADDARESFGRLGEAARVAKAVFVGRLPARRPSMRYFPWPQVVLRPAARQQGGPPLVLLVPAWAVAEAGQQTLVACLRAVDAVAVGGDLEAFRTAAEAVDVARRSSSRSVGAVRVLWRGTLPVHMDRAATVVEEVAEAGAGGIICRLPRGRMPWPAEVHAASRAVQRVFAR